MLEALKLAQGNLLYTQDGRRSVVEAAFVLSVCDKEPEEFEIGLGVSKRVEPAKLHRSTGT